MKKKLLTLALMLTAFVGGAFSQDDYKKSWDFTKGLSEETIANLNADTKNWTANGTDADGNTNNWKNAVNQGASKPWTANVEVIEELRDLLIDIGSNKDNSVHLATTKLRLTREGTKLTFPKLKNGQKITVVGRSANGTATDRGIAPVQSYIKFQADESSSQYNGACIFVGNQVEGSEGTYTFVWKVETDSEDPVDVQFQLTPKGGIDFTLFQIDGGDAPAVEGAKKMAYIGAADDVAYQMLESVGGLETTAVAPADATLEALTNGETGYDVVVFGSSVTPDQAAQLKSLVAFIPVVNLNPALYAEWGYGTAVATEATSITVVDETNAIFEGLTIDGGQLEYLQAGTVTGVTLGDYFANDQVLAKVDDTPVIHVHNAKRNAYYLVPLGADDLGAGDVYSNLLPQTIKAAAATKKAVEAVKTPVISFTQTDGVSKVSITATNSKVIYYTTDGTDPTTESTVYSEPFEVTEVTTVKAFATGDGYTDSQVAEKEVTIAHQADAPTISVAQEAGKSTVTIKSTIDGAKVYFNCNGAATVALSQLYSAPIELAEPATIHAFVVAEGMLTSEQAEKAVDIQGFDRYNEIAHFDANQTDWLVDNTDNGGTGNATAYYYWGKSAWNYYNMDEKIGEEPELDENGKEKKDEEDKTIMKPIYAPDPAAVREILPLNENGWKLRSAGQVLTGELTLAPEAGVGNGAASRYAEEAVDLISAPTKGVITFGAKISGEPYTASIETTKQWQGPFDVVVIAGNGNNGAAAQLEIQVSEDGAAWTKVADVKMAAEQRYFKRTRASYNEDKQVYVRVAHVSGSTKGQVYDILFYNNDSSSAGITTPEVGKKAGSTAIYNLSGQQVTKAYKGLVIVGGKKYVNK